MHAVAEAAEATKSPHPSVLERLLARCTDEHGKLDLLRVRAVTTAEFVPIGENAVSLFDHLLAACQEAGRAWNRSMLEDVVDQPGVARALYQRSTVPVRARLLETSADSDGRVDATVFRMLNAFHDQGGDALTVIERLRAACTDADGQLNRQSMRVVAEFHGTVHPIVFSDFETLLARCAVGPGDFDPLLLRAASTLNLPYGRGRPESLDALLESCATAGGALDRGTLEAVISAPQFREMPATRQNIEQLKTTLGY